MAYRITFSRPAQKRLAKLPTDIQRRISSRIDVLATEPRGGDASQLSGQDDMWRVRVGMYRIVYQIQDAQLVVLVLTVGHRRDVYRDL